MRTSIVPAELNVPHLEAMEASQPLHGRHILVVEDDEFVREAAAETLRSCGHAVLTARTAADATAIFAEKAAELDLLLVDVRIPGRNGLELAREMRQRRPSLKVLCVSGYSENMALRGASLDANTRFMAKPFSLRTLSETVEAMLKDGKEKHEQAQSSAWRNCGPDAKSLERSAKAGR